MYLYIELWKAKEPWLKLTPAERLDKISGLLQEAVNHPITGVVPFSFQTLGGTTVFDGVTERPVVIDPDVARPTRFHYAAAWMVPSRELIKRFEDRVNSLGWWFEYFDQENAWGDMNILATVGDMIGAKVTAPSTGFEGSTAGAQRDGFCWCPAGTFPMGFEGTAVTLTQGFWMAKFEVTQELYRSIMAANPSGFLGDSLPVESVNGEQCLEFCRRLTERERAAGRLPAAWEYNLPTEAQWEYAARTGTNTVFPWGDDPSQADDYCWHMFNAGYTTHPVGQKKPNAWGLYDMLGNCLERCRDAWVDRYPAETDPEVTAENSAPGPGEADAFFGVSRGGGWFIPPTVTPRVRIRLGPGDQGYLLGFRVAITRTGGTNAAQQNLLEWGNAMMGHWVGQFGMVQPDSQSDPENLYEGSASARWLREHTAIEGRFDLGRLNAKFVAIWDETTSQIQQHTFYSDGSIVESRIAKKGLKWLYKETTVYPGGENGSSQDTLTVSEGGNTMQHHITNRVRGGHRLPDIKVILRRVNN